MPKAQKVRAVERANLPTVTLTVTNVCWASDLDDCRHALIELRHRTPRPTGGTTETEVDFYSHPSEGWQINRFRFVTYALADARGQCAIVEQNEFTEDDAAHAFVERIGVLEPHGNGPGLHKFLDSIEDALHDYGIKGVTGRGPHHVLGQTVTLANAARGVNDAK